MGSLCGWICSIFEKKSSPATTTKSESGITPLLNPTSNLETSLVTNREPTTTRLSTRAAYSTNDSSKHIGMPVRATIPTTFKMFGQLPSELRCRIWNMAFEVISCSGMCCFRLDCKQLPGSSTETAFLTPLPMVAKRTKAYRKLLAVNKESWEEGRLRRPDKPHTVLKFLGLKEVGDDNTAVPVQVPWFTETDVLCLVGVVDIPNRALPQLPSNTDSIGDVLRQVKNIAMGMKGGRVDQGLQTVLSYLGWGCEGSRAPARSLFTQFEHLREIHVISGAAAASGKPDPNDHQGYVDRGLFRKPQSSNRVTVGPLKNGVYTCLKWEAGYKGVGFRLVATAWNRENASLQ